MMQTATEVVAALIWDQDKFMICQRPAHKARGLLWEFVGGKVEGAGAHSGMSGGTGRHAECERGIHGCHARIPGSDSSFDTAPCCHPRGNPPETGA